MADTNYLHLSKNVVLSDHEISIRNRLIDVFIDVLFSRERWGTDKAVNLCEVIGIDNDEWHEVSPDYGVEDGTALAECNERELTAILRDYLLYVHTSCCGPTPYSWLKLRLSDLLLYRELYDMDLEKVFIKNRFFPNWIID